MVLLNFFVLSSFFPEEVSFIPYNPDSKLKTLLQNADDQLSLAFRKPKVRFVERGGNPITRDTGRPNPWSQETYCARKDCRVCQGRSIIEAEKEEQALARVGKGNGPPSPVKKEGLC